MSRAVFIKSADTKILESVLSEAKIGETITYEQLSKAIGRDVRVFALNSLGSARRGVLRERQIVFSVVPNVGYIRLDDTEIVKSTEQDRKSIHKKANRVLQKLSCSDYSKLDDTSKRQHIASSAIAGAIAMFSGAASRNKIESKVTSDSKTLAIGDTLKMFV